MILIIYLFTKTGKETDQLKKGDKTRKLIIERAKAYFSAHGYAGATMQDICEACEISRGGLYRYFSSTREIFQAILTEDKDAKAVLAHESITKHVPAQVIFQWFLQDRKATTIVGPDQGFTFAVAEFTRTEPEIREFMQKRRHYAQGELSNIIRYGQKRGEFRECDVDSVSLTILLVLDSLEVNARTLDLTDEEIEDQFIILCNLILKEPINITEHDRTCF